MDRYPRTLPALGLAALAAVLALMTLTGATRLGATLTLIAWGATSFGIGPILKQHAARAAQTAPTLSARSTRRVHLRIAIGAVLGGRVVASGGVARRHLGRRHRGFDLGRVGIDQRARHPARPVGWKVGRRRVMEPSRSVDPGLGKA